jgi:hypothetical protein
MTYRLLSFGFATTFFLAVNASAMAGSLTAGSPSSAPSSSSTQMAPVPSNIPQLNQPSTAAGDTKPLASVSNAQSRLASATVQDMLGQSIGRVRSVQTSASGMPTSVQVALNQAGKTVRLPADQLRYDAKRGIIVAQITQTEIDAMPATSSQTGTTMNEPASTVPASPAGGPPGY